MNTFDEFEGTRESRLISLYIRARSFALCRGGELVDFRVASEHTSDNFKGDYITWVLFGDRVEKHTIGNVYD